MTDPRLLDLGRLVDCERLVHEVLEPFREQRASTSQRWDWHAGALAAPDPMPEGRVLVDTA